MKPTNRGGVAGLRATFMSILICGLAGCGAELLNNVRPYGNRSADGRRGWSVFWVVDRTGCDEETLVAMTTWVPTPSNP